MKKSITFVFAAMMLLYGISCPAAELLEIITPGHEAKLTHQVINENSLLVSVKDLQNNPIKGLKLEDFVIKRGKREAKIQSIEALETSEAVPLNIVLVVDNSYSMKDRRAVKPLLAALGEFFGSLRPIDNVSIVVFSSKDVMNVKAYRLHAKAFSSKSLPELKQPWSPASVSPVRCPPKTINFWWFSPTART